MQLYASLGLNYSNLFIMHRKENVKSVCFSLCINLAVRVTLSAELNTLHVPLLFLLTEKKQRNIKADLEYRPSEVERYLT